MILRRRHIWLITFAVALTVRVIFFFQAADSPFSVYHQVRGLDMATLLRFSEWNLHDPQQLPLLVWHRVLIWSLWQLNSLHHEVLQIFFVQMLLGSFGAVLTADITLHLFGGRRTALFAGIAAALYGPLLLYEFSVLQEAVVLNLIVLAMWALLRARRRRFAAGPSLLAGILLGVCSIGRPVAVVLVVAVLLWSILADRFHRRRRAGALLAGGVAAVWLAAALFNGVLADYPSPFFRVRHLAAAAAVPVGTQSVPGEGITSYGLLPQQKLSRYALAAMRAAGSVPRLFLVDEIPENLNYNYLRAKLPLLRFLPDAGLLTVLALAGIFTLLFASAPHRKQGTLVLGAMLALAIVLGSRGALGRYRLMLVPGMIVLAAYALDAALRSRRAIGRFALLLAAAVGLNLLFCDPAQCAPRPSDHMTWALACEIKGPEFRGEMLAELEEAWQRQGDIPCALRLLVEYLNMQETGRAEMLLAELLLRAPDVPDVRYYAALFAAGRGDWAGARKQLAGLDGSRLPEALQPKFRVLRQIVLTHSEE